MAKLTKTIVDRADPREKQYTVWDSDLKGFGLFVNPAGSKTYFVDYRTPEGKRRRMTIGRHGSITTEQARKLAIETLGGIVLQKEDPLLERQTRRSSLTVTDLCDNYLKAAKKGLILGRSGKPKKSSTLDTDTGRIERHIKPLLGKSLVIDLKRSDISKFIRDVTAGKTAFEGKSDKARGKIVVSGGAGTAARTVGLLGGILSYAVSEGIIEFNPAQGVKRPADKRRERRLVGSEFKAIGKALSNADTVAWQGIIGTKLLLFTGCRLGEIVKLRWEEVSLDEQCFRLGDSKTGASIRPIGKAAVEVLKEILSDRATGWVLPGIRNPLDHIGSLDDLIEKIIAMAGLNGVTAHTLRHSYASVAADLNYSDNTIGAIIGHAGSGTTSRYTHRLDTVLVAAADIISEEIKRQMS
jgi:integrase